MEVELGLVSWFHVCPSSNIRPPATTFQTSQILTGYLASLFQQRERSAAQNPINDVAALDVRMLRLAKVQERQVQPCYGIQPGGIEIIFQINATLSGHRPGSRYSPGILRLVDRLGHTQQREIGG